LARYARSFTVLFIVTLFFTIGHILKNPPVNAGASHIASATPTPGTGATPAQATPAQTSTPAASPQDTAGGAGTFSTSEQFGDTDGKGGPSSAPVNAVTFVQITDAHLFDSGKRGKTYEEGMGEQQDAFAAFHWAVETVNRMVEQGAEIQFVVFSGDFGLEFVRKNGEQPCHLEKQPSDFDKARKNGWPRLYSPTDARGAVVQELEKLKVNTVYMLPGNNDLIEEDPCDFSRYTDFVQEMAKAMPKTGPRIVDLADSGKPAVEGAFRLLGLNSASFKKFDNYKSTCGEEGMPPAATRPDRAGCPQYEMDQLESRISESGYSLVFTHIPDVIDPFSVRQNPSACLPQDLFKPTPCDSWNFPASSTNNVMFRSKWNRVIGQPNVLAIFAGHFHDANRSNYAVRGTETALYNGRAVADKTWVAPPLALKFQEAQCSTCRARVLLLVRVQKGSGPVAVSVVPFWYTGPVEVCKLSILWWGLGGLVAAGAVFWLAASERGRTISSRTGSWLLTPTPLTLLGAIAIYLLTRELLEYITSTLNVPDHYRLVVIFGAIGGFIGSISANKGIVFSGYSAAGRPKLGLEVLEDVLVGMGGATVVAFVFDNVMEIKETDHRQMVLLLGVSFVAGVVGRNLVQIASDKLLHRVADEAAQKALQKANAQSSSGMTSSADVLGNQQSASPADQNQNAPDKADRNTVSPPGSTSEPSTR